MKWLSSTLFRFSCYSGAQGVRPKIRNSCIQQKAYRLKKSNRLGKIPKILSMQSDTPDNRGIGSHLLTPRLHHFTHRWVYPFHCASYHSNEKSFKSIMQGQDFSIAKRILLFQCPCLWQTENMYSHEGYKKSLLQICENVPDKVDQ